MGEALEADKICQKLPIVLRVGQLLPQDVAEVTVTQSDTPEDVMRKVAGALEDVARTIRAEAG